MCRPPILHEVKWRNVVLYPRTTARKTTARTPTEASKKLTDAMNSLRRGRSGMRSCVTFPGDVPCRRNRNSAGSATASNKMNHV